jgi:tetrahydromethanopterin S-methyltransferase subunit B
MHIRTFTGSDDDMTKAIQEAELSADDLIERLNPSELFSVTTQSFVDRHGDGTFAGAHTCFHIITVVYE